MPSPAINQSAPSPMETISYPPPFALSIVLAAASVGLVAPAAFGQNATWGNTATDWNTNSSWSGSTNPGTGAGDVATFNAATPAFQPNISTSVTTGAIVFGTGGWTLSSTDATKTLTLLGTGTSTTTAALINNGTNTISAPLIFGATGAQLIRNNTSSVLNISGSITKSDSGDLMFSNGNTTAISVSGNITAAGKVSVTAGSGVTLSGSNSAGSWDIGTAINLNSAGALGNSGAINFNIAGTSGGLNFTSFNNTDYSSRFTISSGQNYVFNASNAVTVTFASAIVGNGTNAFRVGGAGSAAAGTFILGNASNSFSGPVSVSAGTLSVAGIGNAGANSYLGTNGTINLGASSTAGTLLYTGAGETSDKVINLGGTSGGGTITNNGSGLLKFTSAITAATTAKTFTLSGSGRGEFAGDIGNGSGTVSLTKSGTGIWTLSGTNTYTGGTLVSGGMLQFAKQVSLYNNGTAATWSNSNINVNSGATMAFNIGGAGEFTKANIITLLGLSTATNNGFRTGSILGLDTTSGDFTYDTAIANPNAGTNVLGLTKLGINALTLDQANTYTGLTTISAGTVKLGTSGTIASSSGVNLGTVGSQGTLDLTAKSAFTFNTGQSLDGHGTVNIGTGKTLTVNGTFAPGNGAGIAAITGNLTLGGTSVSNFEIIGRTGGSPVAGTDYDKALVSGTVGFGGTLNISTTVTGLAFGDSFLLFDSTSSSYSGQFASVVMTGTYAPTLAYNGTNAWTGSDLINNLQFRFTQNDGFLRVSAIPEPSSFALFAGFFTMLAALRRRRHN